mmetsp:Transcript_4039/g.6053  ORF Transcript_4039/g.6053 Transcript_4039/m.6053 type:complete len:189 (+) Transcript_4039:56-622(+)|eukprot:CAMPEP_0201550172 /NCGR_PEP_ID=MMETSP0173_2-20130828/6570_1 /ASSEMBLY_ACC=CAM_ASM_000268 /TAXON_ID=218659 /ORGANISM="Vexillifera sp., Strain DIVA3 564/2" /LENGTH=188 /DNA_ID=CAMNT_0047960077 /DNA_START=34 /DNA_END=600 /DNA_ORIENTATION=-
MENNDPNLPTNTLDEPVYMTLWRDAKMVGIKTFHVLVPTGKGSAYLVDWDLWGPLVYCFIFAMMLSLEGPDDQGSIIFTGTFAIIWLGAGFITINAKLLGGKCSFWQSLSVVGYCVFPMMVGSIMVFFWSNIIFRLIVVGVSLLWATWATVGFFSGMSSGDKRALVVYPVLLFFMVLGWLVLIAPTGK